MNVLLAYATTEGQTAHIADKLRAKLEALELDVTMADLERNRPDATAFDRVVVAASVHLGKFQKEAGEFVARYIERLNSAPSWFIGVSLSEAGGEKPGGHDAAQAMIDTFLVEHGWRPTGALSLAGAIKYREYNVLKRMMMKRIAGQQGGETDTTRNWDYTDWSAVDHLAEEIARTAVPA